MKNQSKPLSIEYWIIEFINNLKNQTIVTIGDLEKFNNKSMNLLRAIEDLRESRLKWRVRAEKAEKRITELLNEP